MGSDGGNAGLNFFAPYLLRGRLGRLLGNHVTRHLVTPDWKRRAGLELERPPPAEATRCFSNSSWRGMEISVGGKVASMG